MTVSS